MASPPTSYSFACSGWLKTYHFGVAKALQDLGLHKGATVLGSSGGSLAALGLALDCDFDAMVGGVVQDFVPLARASLGGACNVRSYLREAIARYGNFERITELNATERCVVVYSSISKWRSRRVTRFRNATHATDAVLASCCATPIAGFPFRIDGEWVFDGGIFDFQPVVDASTITVSPFYCTTADIKPSQYVPMWWAVYPPAPESIQWLYELGQRDAIAWAKAKGLTTRTVVPPVRWGAHSYRTSLGRFLGYRFLENKLLDALFVTAVVALWKPLAFGLLYTELWVRAVVSAAHAAAYAVATAGQWTLSAVIAVAAGFAALSVVAPVGLNPLLGLVVCFLLCAFSSTGRLELEAAVSKWRQCITCVQIVFSMSLFLRSIPIVGASVALKKHKFLVEHSVVYRLITHCV
ncbi:patatin-like phospholipase [Achlya hypogyna]|uniref:Patatin-like phospholipase n=1 Tax=Achlya hypogyna TaxID=1202772 RepID=A0A1V9YNE4_ACHHY|nr:patatin-like phospholipase [Achlya hypogyna]